MKKFLVIPLLVLALVLAACGTSNVNETPVGTASLGTETSGLATSVSTSAAGVGTAVATKAAGAATAVATTAATKAATAAATSAATKAATSAATTAATSAATKAATSAATTSANATTQPTGLVAIPYSMLEVATMAGAAPGTGVAATGTPAAAGTPAATKAATAAATTSANATTTANAERTMVRASELIDSKVVDMKGTLVGTVLEVLADKAGALQYVIVDATSFLGAGTSTGGTGAAATGTPAAAGTTSATAAATKAATSAATSAATTAATKAATAVATTSSAVGTQTGQIGLATKDTVLVYTGTQSELKTSGLPVDRKVLDAEGFVVDTTAAKAQMDAKLNGMIRLGKFGEFKVNDAKNDKLGDVKDLILDAQQGKLQYGVIDFGGFLGIGEQTVAVPWQRFTLNAPAGATASANLTLDVTEQTLRNAPKFDISKWPAWPQPLPTGWENETRTFWQTAS